MSRCRKRSVEVPASAAAMGWCRSSWEREVGEEPAYAALEGVEAPGATKHSGAKGSRKEQISAEGSLEALGTASGMVLSLSASMPTSIPQY